MPSKSYKLSMAQLKVIERYLKDFKNMIKTFSDNTGYGPAGGRLNRIMEDSEEDD